MEQEAEQEAEQAERWRCEGSLAAFEDDEGEGELLLLYRPSGGRGIGSYTLGDQEVAEQHEGKHAEARLERAEHSRGGQQWRRLVLAALGGGLRRPPHTPSPQGALLLREVRIIHTAEVGGDECFE